MSENEQHATPDSKNPYAVFFDEMPPRRDWIEIVDGWSHEVVDSPEIQGVTMGVILAIVVIGLVLVVCSVLTL